MNLVDDELMFAISKIFLLNATIGKVDRFAVDEEVYGSRGVFHFNIEDDLFPLHALLEVTHALLEAIVICAKNNG